MKKSTIIWCLWVIVMLFMMIMLDNYAIQIILAVSVLVPIVGVVCSYLSASALKLELKGNVSQQKKYPIEYTLEVENKGKMFCSQVAAKLEFENKLTGENFEEKVVFSVAPKQKKFFSFHKTFEHCGKICISVKDVNSCDFVGLISKRIECSCRHNTLILPETFPIEIDLGNGNKTDLNSDEYSMYKSGFDPSETFAIREYRAGDKIKNIHWKLSEKLDEITVRELGLPVNNTVLLLLDTSVPAGCTMPTPHVMDALGEAVISLAEVLCNQQIPFQLSWYDRECGMTDIREIMNNDDLTAAMAFVLSAQTAYDEKTILEHFTEDRGGFEYAHIIVVGINSGLAEQADNCEGKLSHLICIENKNGVNMNENAKGVYYFTPETMSNDLFFVEV